MAAKVAATELAVVFEITQRCDLSWECYHQIQEPPNPNLIRPTNQILALILARCCDQRIECVIQLRK